MNNSKRQAGVSATEREERSRTGKSGEEALTVVSPDMAPGVLAPGEREISLQIYLDVVLCRGAAFKRSGTPSRSARSAKSRRSVPMRSAISQRLAAE